MATLNQLAASIANQLRQPFNHEFKERIKDLFKEEVSLFIRRSIKEHGIDEVFKISYTAEVEEVSALNKPIKISNDSKVIRTKNRVPTPVRFKNESPFTLVSMPNSTYSIPKRNVREHAFMHSFSPTGINYSYDYINGFIEVYYTPTNSFKSDYIIIESIFESPEEVISMYDDVDGQDIELPIPTDILSLARDRVLQKAGNVIQENINVEQDNIPQK